MSLFEKIKNFMEKRNASSVDFTYDLIMEELNNYEIEEADLEIAGDEKLAKEKQQQVTQRILSLIDENEDSIIIYKMPHTYKPQKTIIGIEKSPITKFL